MDYLELLDSYREDMLKTLSELVSFASVSGDPVRTRDGEILPYGRGVHDALMYMLEEGGRLGFDAYNLDNKAGYLELPADRELLDDGAKPKRLDIVCHLDVVPAGDGWTDDPFTMTMRDGKLYGRGVSDDKGPLVACIYALKALKESGVKFDKNIRIVLGLDEEVGGSSMEYYVEQCGHPDAGFTADADFPLINGEKGVLRCELDQKLSRLATKDGLRLTKMEAGEVLNAVPKNAKAVVAGDEQHYDLIKDRLSQYVLETGYNVKAKKQGSSLVIEATGVAAHGAHPEAGLNAISILMDFLGRLQFMNEEINDFIDFYNSHIGFDVHGERLNCEFSDEYSNLTCNAGIARINEEIATLGLDIRYPVTLENADPVLEGIQNAIGSDKIGVVKLEEYNPVFISLDNPLVEKLISAYRDETGDNDTLPIVIGGSTYAKFVNNILAFGAMFPDEEDTMHQADEYKDVELLFKAARIYARCLYEI